MTSVRFQFDEHLPDVLATSLRDRGIDVVTADEVNLRGRPDPEVLAVALANSRVIVTRDRDFLKLHAAGSSHAGIVFFGPHITSIGVLLETLLTIHGVYVATDMANTLHFG